MRRAGALGGLLRQLPTEATFPRSCALSAAFSAALHGQTAACTDATASSMQIRQLSTSRSAAGLHVADEPYMRQRQLISLGARTPTLAPDTWLADDAVVIGDVDLYDRVSVWNGAVIRGDLNHIRVNAYSSVGDRTVIHAARSSPTGLPAATTIGRHVIIGNSCLLRSCQIQHEAIIGDRCILLEGSMVEGQSVLAAGSLLAPGRLVPRGQLWAGAPARYVRDLSADEKAGIAELAEAVIPLAAARVDEVLPTSEAYRDAEALREQLITKFPEYKAMLSGWEDTPVTPDDL